MLLALDCHQRVTAGDFHIGIGLRYKSDKIDCYIVEAELLPNWNLTAYDLDVGSAVLIADSKKDTSIGVGVVVQQVTCGQRS